MVAREQVTESRTPANKYGLVVPVIVHDGETISKTLGPTQWLDIKECYNTRMRRDGAKAEVLSDKIHEHAGGIAGAIAHAPAWQESWPLAAAKKLFTAYYTSEASQNWVPRFSVR